MANERTESGRCNPQPGDIILYGKPNADSVSEVPAIILAVHIGADGGCRVDLKTFEMGHEMEPRRSVAFAQAPKPGHWRWRPDR